MNRDSLIGNANVELIVFLFLNDLNECYTLFPVDQPW